MSGILLDRTQVDSLDWSRSAYAVDVRSPLSLYARRLKPVLDLFLGLVLLLLAVPLLLTIALLVRIFLGPGVIYKQRRVGRGGRVFTMYKFRTMLPDRRTGNFPFAGEDRRVSHKRDDDPRHTPFGRLLRKSSLDELPQLWNVVKCDMSLVGPRPELPQIVGKYADWQHQRHQVKPGLTGFWQISDRAGGLAYEGVDLDIRYLHQISFWTDFLVLLRTIPVALQRTGR